MASAQQDFIVQHYTSRAEEYVTSTTHSTGEDLHQLEEELSGCSTASVLDLGCGGGHVSYTAAPHVASVTACDLTTSMLDAVQKTASERGLSNISVRQAAAEHLPFEDSKFDIVLCRFSAHHWQNMEAGLREARRVLTPAGRAIFIDVVAPADPLLDTHLQTFELLRDPSHVRNYTVAEWIAALSRSGFATTQITTRRLQIEFANWTRRAHTSEPQASAVRTTQAAAPETVRTYFSIAPDGSFELDTATIINRTL